MKGVKKYGEFAGIVTRNCLFPAPGQNCMTHSPALTVTAAKLLTQQCSCV